MRRLPIYFLIDISESMIGEPIQQVEEGLSTIIQALKADPNALETVWISIIVFAGKSKTLVPLQEIINFYPPKFPIGSGTSLCEGLGHLMHDLRKNIIRTTAETKGDWKPIVFLFTDGVPTDDSHSAIAEWKTNWKKTANMVAVSFGDETDTYILQELTDNVIHFKNSDTASYKQFFRWVTDSIKTTSTGIQNHTNDFELANLDGEIISKIDLSKKAPQQKVDSNYVVLSGKCQNSKRPYLIKYRKDLKPANIPGFEFSTRKYRLEGAFQVDQNYYALSKSYNPPNKVNTEELVGAPTCPCCGNQFAFAICSCGNMHCIGMEELNTCPWCGTAAQYGFGEGGMDVNRTLG